MLTTCHHLHLCIKGHSNKLYKIHASFFFQQINSDDNINGIRRKNEGKSNHKPSKKTIVHWYRTLTLTVI